MNNFNEVGLNGDEADSLKSWKYKPSTMIAGLSPAANILDMLIWISLQNFWN